MLPWQSLTETLDYSRLHHLVWEYASCILQGRFPKKLADAAIWDSSYCRYLSGDAIRSLESFVHLQWQSGVYSDDQLAQCGLFIAVFSRVKDSGSKSTEYGFMAFS